METPIQEIHIFGIHMVVAMAFAGTLGGVLFGYRQEGLVFPFWEQRTRRRTLNLGFIADCVWGASGALVVFVIIPLDLTSGSGVAAQMTHNIKLLAIAFIGGYGGPAVMDLALSRTFKDLADRTEQVAQQTEDMQSKLDKREQQDALDIKALEYVDIQLSDTMAPAPEHELVAAIREASPAALENIFQRAKETRHHAWLLKQRGEESHQMTERTIPIFMGLLGSHYGNQRHRYHAQLAYALKDQDKPEWEKAKEALENATKLLEESNRPMSPYYKFNWALCAIELDVPVRPSQRSSSELREAVAEALRVACNFWKLKAAVLNNESIGAWLKRNRLSYEALGLPTAERLVVSA